MNKNMLGIVIVTVCMMAGCSQQPVQVEDVDIVDSDHEEEVVIEAVGEFKLETVDIHTLEPYDVMYTPYESDRFIFTNINNIFVQIEEYYNENTMLYSYVLTVEEGELEEDSEDIIYKIIKILVGTLRDNEKGIYTLSTTSPLYISDPNTQKLDINFTNQAYFLFSSEKRLFDEEFRIELVMIGEEDFNDNYPETFRLVHTSGGGIDGYTLVTD